MTHKNQLFAGIIATLIVAGGAGFYGGMQYQKKNSEAQGGRDRNIMFGQGRGQGSAQNGSGQGRQGRMTGGGPNGDFTNGEVTAKDDKSITVKTRDGSSKIIYFSDSTLIGKATQGSISDLNTGNQVSVNGKSNPDGTLSAQNIQIRPDAPGEQPQN